MKIAARFKKQVLTYDDETHHVTADRPGFWDTFAQDSPAKGWVHGITDEVRGEVLRAWSAWVHKEVPRISRQKLKDVKITPKQADKAATVFENMAKEQFELFRIYMHFLETKNSREPMRQSVAMLPKDELGLLAESLVNLTSLRQRMSIHQQNTVGGAIDVALISVGDGFVWLNRKHYFTNDLNPTWHLTHGASIRTSDSTMTTGAG